METKIGFFQYLSYTLIVSPLRILRVNMYADVLRYNTNIEATSKRLVLIFFVSQEEFNYHFKHRYTINMELLWVHSTLDYA